MAGFVSGALAAPIPATVVVPVVRARYDYDAYGQRSEVGGIPTAHSGQLAHASASNAVDHQHYFYGATATMPVQVGDKLTCWIYLDPTNLPRQVMLQWNDGSWEHRAYWGENLISYGIDGTNSRRSMGPLPRGGGWVRLEVLASLLGLEGSTLNGMAFTLYGATANWDRTGKITNTGLETVWVEDTAPTGAMFGGHGGHTWSWSDGGVEASFGYTGHYVHAPSGLHLALYRAYDADLGRWLSRDPIGEAGGLNLYGYVGNRPTVSVDPYGLDMTLPNNPSGLGPEWTPDPTHKNPNGQRFRGPGGKCLDWHPGTPGKPGWKGKDHWHSPDAPKGPKDHLPPGTEIPDPAPPPPSPTVNPEQVKDTAKKCTWAVAAAAILGGLLWLGGAALN